MVVIILLSATQSKLWLESFCFLTTTDSHPQTTKSNLQNCIHTEDLLSPVNWLGVFSSSNKQYHLYDMHHDSI